MVRAALISSSPAPRSRIGVLGHVLIRELTRMGVEVTTIELRDVPHSALLAGNHRHPSIRWTHQKVGTAHAAVFVTPVNDVPGSIPLRRWLSLLPHGALSAKTVQAVGLGRFPSHSTKLDTWLTDRAPGNVLPGCFLHEQWLEADAAGWRLVPGAADLLTRTAAGVSAAVATPEAAYPLAS